MFLITCAIGSGAQTWKKKALIGKWQFEKFISESSDVTTEETRMIKDANTKNKGLTIRFSIDNAFKSEQKGGMLINNSSGKYIYLGDDRVVIMGDTLGIILDSVHLTMYHPGRPLMIFRHFTN